MLAKFKIATRGQFYFFCVAKNSKSKVGNYWNFTIKSPTTWRCAGAFFKVLQKLKMAATDQLNFFVGAKKK